MDSLLGVLVELSFYVKLITLNQRYDTNCRKCAIISIMAKIRFDYKKVLNQYGMDRGRLLKEMNTILREEGRGGKGFSEKSLFAYESENRTPPLSRIATIVEALRRGTHQQILLSDVLTYETLGSKTLEYVKEIFRELQEEGEKLGETVRKEKVEKAARGLEAFETEQMVAAEGSYDAYRLATDYLEAGKLYLKRFGDLVKAKKAFENAVTFYGDKYPINKIDAMFFLADVKFERGEYEGNGLYSDLDQCIVFYQDVLEKMRKGTKKDNEDIFNTQLKVRGLTGLSRVYSRLGNNLKAITLCGVGDSVLTAKLNEKPELRHSLVEEKIRIIRNEAASYYNLELLSRAIEKFNVALDICSLSKHKELRARIYTDLANCYRKRVKTLPKTEKDEAVAQTKTYLERAEALAKGYVSSQLLCYVYFTRGQVLRTLDGVSYPGYVDPDKANIIDAYLSAYAQLVGEFRDRARIDFSEVLEDISGGESHAFVYQKGMIMLKLGKVWKNKGDINFNSALESMCKAADFLIGHRRAYVHVQCALGELYLSRQYKMELGKAKEHFEKARKRIKKFLKQNIDRSFGKVSIGLGRVHFENKDLERASKEFETAVDVLNIVNHPYLRALSLELLANTRKAQGRLESAVNYYRLAHQQFSTLGAARQEKRVKDKLNE